MARDEHKALRIRRDDVDNSPAVSLTGIELDTYRVHRGGEQAPPADDGGGFSVRDLLYALFTHKWKIVISFLTISLATAVYVAGQSDYYVSEAKVLVTTERSMLGIDPSAAGGEDSLLASMGGGRGDWIRTETAMLRSYTVAEEAVDRVGDERIVFTPERLKLHQAEREARRLADAGLSAAAAEEPTLLDKSLAKLGRGRSWLMETLNLAPPSVGIHDFAVRSVVKGLEVRPTMSGSQVLQVQFASHSPETARDVLAAVIEAYGAQNIAINRSEFSAEFWEEEVQKSRIELSEKVLLLEERRRELNIASLPEERAGLVEEIRELSTELRSVRQVIMQLEIEVEELNKLMSGMAEELEVERIDRVASPTTERLEAEILELKIDELELMERYKGDNGGLLMIRSNIKKLEKLLADGGDLPQQVTRALNPVRQERASRRDSAKIEILTGRATEIALEKNLKDARDELTRLIASGHEIEELARDVEVLSVNYKQYASSAAMAKIADKLDESKVSNMRVVQQATLPVVSAKSQRKMLALLAFGIVMGLAFGMGLAITLEFMNHSLKTSEEVERKLGLPVLAVVPQMRGHRPEPRKEVA